MTVKLTVQGMSCDHCVRAVRDALARVPGVDRVVDVSRERGEAAVEGHPDVAALIAALAAAGYAAKAV
ncbi:MAG: heavy-metal-associated domain-containing protein [Rhodospirillales bacterium]